MKPNACRVLATKQGSTELVVSSIETGGMLGSRITPACVKNMTVAKGGDVELLVVAKVMSLDPLTLGTSTVKSALLGLSEQCPLERKVPSWVSETPSIRHKAQGPET